VIIYCDMGKLVSRDRISQMEKDLPALNFIRIHRRYLVAVNKIDTVRGNMISVVGQNLPIGRTYQSNLKMAIGI